MTNEEVQRHIDLLLEDLLAELENYKVAIHVTQPIDRNNITAKISAIESKIQELRAELKQ